MKKLLFAAAVVSFFFSSCIGMEKQRVKVISKNNETQIKVLLLEEGYRVGDTIVLKSIGRAVIVK